MQQLQTSTHLGSIDCCQNSSHYSEVKSPFNGVVALPIPLQHSQHIYSSVVPSFGVPHPAVPPVVVVVAMVDSTYTCCSWLVIKLPPLEVLFERSPA